MAREGAPSPVPAPPSLLSGDDWERLSDAVQGGSRHQHRDRALLALFWYLGPTVGEALRLDLDNVNLLSGRLCWPPAGPEVPLPGDLLRELRAYVACERRARCSALFCGRRGRRLRPGAVDRLFRRLADASTLPVNPRILRRTALFRQLQVNPLRAIAAVRRGRAGSGAPGHPSAAGTAASDGVAGPSGTAGTGGTAAGSGTAAIGGTAAAAGSGTPPAGVTQGDAAGARGAGSSGTAAGTGRAPGVGGSAGAGAAAGAGGGTGTRGGLGPGGASGARGATGPQATGTDRVAGRRRGTAPGTGGPGSEGRGRADGTGRDSQLSPDGRADGQPSHDARTGGQPRPERNNPTGHGSPPGHGEGKPGRA